MDRYELILLRLKSGLKQYEIAQQLHVPQTVICDMERGRRSITPEMETKLKEAINVAERPGYNCREGEGIVDLPLPKIQGNRTKHRKGVIRDGSRDK